MSVILFDLSDVIVRGLKGSERALSNDLQLPPETIYRQFHEPELRELFLGRIDERQYWRTLLDRHGWNTTVESLEQRVRANMVEVEGMFDLIARLQARGVTLALLSNHTAPWADHIEQRYPQLRDYFPIRLYSHELHLAKPDPLSYQHAAERLDRQPSEILFVDDHQPNLIGAARVGMRTLPFHTPHQLRDALATMGYLQVDGIRSPSRR